MPRGQRRRGGGRRPYALRNRQGAEHQNQQQRRNGQPQQHRPAPPVHQQHAQPNVVQPADVQPAAVQLPAQQQIVQPAAELPAQQLLQQLPVQQASQSFQTLAVSNQQGNAVICNLEGALPNQNEPLLIPGFSTEIDIFITQAMKDKVWNFEYVDLSLFLRQNFENNIGQKPCSLEIVDGKLVVQQRTKRIKHIDNISSWTNAFLNYMLVLLENHPC